MAARMKEGDRVVMRGERCTLLWPMPCRRRWMVRGELGTYAPMRTRDLRKARRWKAPAKPRAVSRKLQRRARLWESLLALPGAAESYRRAVEG